MIPPNVSVILGTYNRFALLRDAVESVRSSVKPFSHEIVITDGGSTDGSLEWMRSQPDIVIAETGNLRGAVSAFNAAWAASIGEFVANFNDDAVYVDDALAMGVLALMESTELDGDVGQVAFEFDAGGSWHIADFYGSDLHCANFGVTRRHMARKVCAKQGGAHHYWNPIYHTYAGDCEFSAWVWRLGYSVKALPEVRVHDIWAMDELRQQNQWKSRGDALLFNKRWPNAATIRGKIR